MSNMTEHAIWEFVNALGWWWWGGVAFLGASNFFNVLLLSPAQTRYGRGIRIVLMMGYLCLAASPGNTALGPLGVPLVLIGNLMLTHQLYLQCVREGKARPFWGTFLATTKSVICRRPSVRKAHNEMAAR